MEIQGSHGHAVSNYRLHILLISVLRQAVRPHPVECEALEKYSDRGVEAVKVAAPCRPVPGSRRINNIFVDKRSRALDQSLPQQPIEGRVVAEVEFVSKECHARYGKHGADNEQEQGGIGHGLERRHQSLDDGFQPLASHKEANRAHHLHEADHFSRARAYILCSVRHVCDREHEHEKVYAILNRLKVAHNVHISWRIQTPRCYFRHSLDREEKVEDQIE